MAKSIKLQNKKLSDGSRRISELMLLEDEQLWMYEMLTKLSGAILSKAMLDNDFLTIYRKVFEKMMDETAKDEMEMLEIFGNVGG